MRTVKRFSEAEDEVIRSQSASVSGADIAKQLNRPSASVISRQVALGLRVPNRTVRRFAENDDAAIRASVGKESVYDLAARDPLTAGRLVKGFAAIPSLRILL